MKLSMTEAVARKFVIRFLKGFISAGCLTLLEEEDDNVLTFEGSRKICPLNVELRIHSPQFYWKVAKEAEMGFADAYVQGDISFVDKDYGLVNIITLFITNKYLISPTSAANKRDWWTSLFFKTTWIATAKYTYRHLFRRNTLEQARRNISQHYDLSNELFSLFIDDTMIYSCAIFKSEDEDLNDAQMRKMSLLIEKARVEEHHEVLEVGCGWGSLGIEVVKRTGCRYTGITLSEEQLKFAEERVKKEGLEDRIRFLLCDYRQLQDAQKYDRIFICEMIEAVGHEYLEEFFRCCDSVLATNGLIVLQFIGVPDECYDEFRRPGFLLEHIFPGGCLPSVSRIISVPAAAARLRVEHVENIGHHYYRTLRCWRKNFLENQSKIRSLGFDDEKFIRTWEYYFDYCAAAYKTELLKNYQIVYSRQGDVDVDADADAVSDPYARIPSAHRCS